MLGGRRPHAIRFGPDADDALLPRPVIVVDEPAHAGPAADGATDDDGRVARLDRDVAALAAARLNPVGRGDRPAVGLARQADRPVVLLRAIDPVRLLVVRAHVVELRGRLVVDARPRLGAVVRHARAAVIALDHPAGVRRIDPEVVVVAVRRRHLDERLAAVDRLPQRVVRDPHGVDVGRVGEDVHVVPGTAAEPGLLARALPGRAPVIGSEERAVLGLDQRVDAAAIGRGDGDADPSEDAARQAGVARDVGPRVAAVGRLPERRIGPAAAHAPGRALRLPHRGKQDARILLVDRQVDGAGPLALEQHVLPRGAAIAGAEDPALAVRAPGVAERRHVDEVGIARVHADAPDVAGVAQSHVGPRAAAVIGAIDPVPMRHVAADARFAGARVQHARRRGRDGQRADRRGLEEAVGHVLPVGPAVRRLPDTARAGPEVERHGLGRMAGHRDHAAAAVRADAAPLERAKQPGIDGHAPRPGRKAGPS